MVHPGVLVDCLRLSYLGLMKYGTGLSHPLTSKLAVQRNCCTSIDADSQNQEALEHHWFSFNA